jgi:hypothetical protein
LLIDSNGRITERFDGPFADPLQELAAAIRRLAPADIERE